MKHCYGFVRYKHRTDAEKAKHAMDGSTIGKRTVLVKWGEADLVRSSVQVQFDQQSKHLITKSSLYSTFSKFGKVESVEICTRGDGLNMGVAFVEFEDSDAVRASFTSTESLSARDVKLLVVLFERAMSQRLMRLRRLD
mmetsp:Transcript_22675/g.90845  ORF Transcript_22675/g.90845 Transcript_22675/m.90845 type:complete len:139 (-) Transcript_22675:1140-1556(-)